MTAHIHPSAIVDPSAQLGNDVEVGPWSIIGPGCVIGDGGFIASRVTIEKNVTLGARVRVGNGSVIGGDPQDLKYRGEETFVEIGADTVIREFVTVNRGTSHSWTTRIGEKCFLMSNVHVAHDCVLGNHVIISNATLLAGHVHVEDRVTISGLCAIHQFVRIGRFSMVGGVSKVTQDIPPFVRASGNPAALYGLNTVGLKRNGFTADTMRELKRAYQMCFKSELNTKQAIERARDEIAALAEVTEFLGFIEASQRGVA